MKKLFLIVFILTGFTCYSQDYKIDVTINGIEEGTIIYLCDLSTNQYVTIDSAAINGGKILFTGKMNYPIMNLGIRTKDFKNRVTFWVEDKPMTIVAEVGKFKQASIEGSETQKDKEADIATNKSSKQDAYLYAINNPNKFYSVNYLAIYCSKLGKDSTEAAFKNFSNLLKESVYGKRIATFLNVSKDIKLNGDFAEISLPDPNGLTQNLSSLKGKVVLISYWGSWCGPCREKNPKLIELYNTFKEKGFEIYAIGVENIKENWIKAIKEDKLTCINVSDLLGESSPAVLTYNVSHYPASYLINKEGKIVAIDISIENLKNYLQQNL